MKLKTLKFKNLFSYEKAEINLGELDLTLFKGINGAGKSSTFDVLCWVLYGTTARKKYKNILRNSPDKPKNGYAVIDFTVDDGTVYKIERGIGVKKFFRLYKDDLVQKFRTSTMIQDEIVKIIGVDYKTFLNIAYFSQGDVGKFLTSESGERINIITDMLSELGDIDKLKKSIDYDAKKISYETENLKGQLLAHKEIISGVDILKLKKEIKMKESSISKYTEQLVEFSQALSMLNEKKEFIEQLEKLQNEKGEYVEDVKTELEQINKSIKGLEGKKGSEVELNKKYNSIIAELNKLGNIKSDYELNKKEISILEEKNIEYKTSIEYNVKEISALEKVMKMKNSTCPTCKSIIDDENIKHLSTLSGSRQNENKVFNKSIAENLKLLKNHYSKREKLENKIGDINKLNSKKTDIKNELQNLKNLSDDINQLKVHYRNKKSKSKEKIENYKLKIKQTKDDLSYLVKYNLDDYDSVKSSYHKYDILMQEMEDAIKKEKITADNYYRSVKKITEIEKELNEYNDDEKVISFWSVALPKIKVDMIAGIIPFLESESNKYLSQILPGKMVKFIADSGKANNKLDVMIYDIENNVERIYEGWSGGEKSKMSISVYLALNKLASLRSGKTIDFLILDEKFSEIDFESRMTLMEMLKNEYKGRKIWAISHVENLDSEFKQIVIAKKINGISKLVV